MLTFLSSVKKSPILGGIADFDDFSTSEKLHDETRRDDRRDTELHQCPPVGSEDDTDPVEGIRAVGRHDSKKRNLKFKVTYCESAEATNRNATFNG